MNKPKTTQPETPNKVQGRDLFQTPNYATNLLVPFIPKNIDTIWECAAGEGKIVHRLMNFGYNVLGSDIRKDLPNVLFHNFIGDYKLLSFQRSDLRLLLILHFL